MQLTDWAVFIPALTFVSGLIGLLAQRFKTKKEADNFVVSGAANVVEMYEQVTNRHLAEIVTLTQERDIERSKNLLLSRHNYSLEQALRAAGLPIPHV